MPQLIDHPFPTKASIVHELGHLLVSVVLTPRADGIIFYARLPGTIALATYNCDKVSASCRLAIAVAGVVASHDAAEDGGFGELPRPEDVFGAEHNESFQEYYGDRQSVDNFTSGLDADKKRAAIVRAIARTRRELKMLGGVPLILAIAQGTHHWLEADNCAKWRQALGLPGEHASVFLNHNAVIRILNQIAEEKPELATCASLVRDLIQEQWAR